MTVGDLLVPQKDTLSNRVISFIANQIFDTDVAPQLNDVRFYLWTRFEKKFSRNFSKLFYLQFATLYFF